MKNILKLMVVLVLITTSIISSAQIANSFTQNSSDKIDDIIDSVFQDNTELNFKFIAESKEQVDTYLTNIMSIDYYKPSTNEVIAYAGKEEFKTFLKLNIPYSVIPKNNNEKAITMATTIAQMASWNRYPTYSVYDSMMTKFQTDYPNFFKRYNLVTLSSGRKLIIGKLTSNVNVKAAKPQFLWVSSIHGDEITGYVSLLRFINYLLTNYGTNARVTNIVDNIELWILPDANPDGTYYNSSTGTTVANARRYNANGKDLNRNYLDPRIGNPSNSGDNLNYPVQTETQTMMNFADTMNFVMGGNFHGGASVVNFPWDTWASSSRTHADDAWWRVVGKEFADTCIYLGPINSISNYFKDTYSIGYTEGGDWYVITGGRQDYMNYFQHCREVTLEISVDKTPSSDLLPNYWNTLYRPIMHYTEECLYGIRGIVSDSCTGKPIAAKVFVNSHDVDSSWVYSGALFGNYYRPIKAGTWSLTFSATGYQSRTISVTATDGHAVIKNVKLMPSSPLSPVAGYTYAVTTNTVNFTNSSTNALTYSWNFGDGGTSTTVSPSHTYASTGTYTVQLTAYNGCGGSNTTSKQVTITTVGINEVSELNSFKVFPNPGNGVLNLTFGDNSFTGNIEVINNIGEQIFKINISNEKSVQLNLSDVKDGLYFLRISDNENVSYKKFIISNQ